VRPLFVVVSTPDFQLFASVLQVQEPVRVQALAAQLAVERLDERPFDRLRTGLSVSLPGREKSRITQRWLDRISSPVVVAQGRES